MDQNCWEKMSASKMTTTQNMNGIFPLSKIASRRLSTMASNGNQEESEQARCNKKNMKNKVKWMVAKEHVDDFSLFPSNGIVRFPSAVTLNTFVDFLLPHWVSSTTIHIFCVLLSNRLDWIFSHFSCPLLVIEANSVRQWENDARVYRVCIACGHV